MRPDVLSNFSTYRGVVTPANLKPSRRAAASVSSAGRSHTKSTKRGSGVPKAKTGVPEWQRHEGEADDDQRHQAKWRTGRTRDPPGGGAQQGLHGPLLAEGPGGQGDRVEPGRDVAAGGARHRRGRGNSRTPRLLG